MAPLSTSSKSWSGHFLSTPTPIEQQILSLLPSKCVLNMISAVTFLHYSVDRVQRLRVLWDSSFTLRPHRRLVTESCWRYLQYILQTPPLPQLYCSRWIKPPHPYPLVHLSLLFPGLCFFLVVLLSVLHRADLKLKSDRGSLLLIHLYTFLSCTEGSPRSYLGQTCT